LAADPTTPPIVDPTPSRDMIERMLRGLVYIALASTACDDAWDLEHIPPPPCTEFMIRDDFASGEPCAGWGNVNKQDAELIVADGHLTITASLPGAYGACTAILPAAVPSTGIFTEVSDIQNGDAWFGIKTATDRLLIYAGVETLRLSTLNKTFGIV